MEKDQEILEKCTQLFFRFGVRNITMDEVASQLGISKKTLYQHFENKADLVEKMMRSFIGVEESQSCAILDGSLNAIEEMYQIFIINFKRIGEMNPILVLELKKYHSNVWQQFETHKNDFIFKSILRNLEQGISEGLYRPEINTVIISKIYTGRLDMIADGHLFPANQFSIKDVMKEIFHYHIHGIASQKGLEVLEQLDTNIFNL